MNYIQKDPGAPCSLTEALEYLQVDVLENLMKNDHMAVNQNQPPKHKPQNFTVVAMEGCHSFIILDWAKPLKDDMVSGKELFHKTKLYLLKYQHTLNDENKRNVNFESVALPATPLFTSIYIKLLLSFYPDKVISC